MSSSEFFLYLVLAFAFLFAFVIALGALMSDDDGCGGGDWPPEGMV